MQRDQPGLLGRPDPRDHRAPPDSQAQSDLRGRLDRKGRTFFVDEDSWQIVLVDCYDKRDQLWRTQESHSLAVYDPGLVTKEASGSIGPAMEVVYDLTSRRYLAMSMGNEEAVGYEHIWPGSYFDPANVSKLVTK